MGVVRVEWCWFSRERSRGERGRRDLARRRPLTNTFRLTALKQTNKTEWPWPGVRGGGAGGGGLTRANPNHGPKEPPMAGHGRTGRTQPKRPQRARGGKKPQGQKGQHPPRKNQTIGTANQKTVTPVREASPFGKAATPTPAPQHNTRPQPRARLPGRASPHDTNTVIHKDPH